MSTLILPSKVLHPNKRHLPHWLFFAGKWVFSQGQLKTSSKLTGLFMQTNIELEYLLGFDQT
jgi:hypothetical protein